MKAIHNQCVRFGEKDGWINYVDGANIAGFRGANVHHPRCACSTSTYCSANSWTVTAFNASSAPPANASLPARRGVR